MEKICEVCSNRFNTKNKKTRSCGNVCGKVLQRKTLGHHPGTKHGFAKTGEVERLHNIWRDMFKRCKSNRLYKGISVCSEWNDYLVFKDWCLQNGYSSELSIDRIDNNGDYSPDNCRWTDSKTQARNRRTSRFICYNNTNKTVAEWAELFDMPYERLFSRVFKLGWDIERALTT